MANDLFGSRPRRPARQMMHVEDAGNEYAKYLCKKCGHDTGWIEHDVAVTIRKRGLPCPVCNKESE